MTVKTYDPASYELAEHFLQDEPCRDDPELYKKHCHSLALEIQQAVEDWLFVPEVAWMGAPHTQPDIVTEIVDFLNAVYDAIGNLETDKNGNVRWAALVNIQREIGQKACDYAALPKDQGREALREALHHTLAAHIPGCIDGAWKGSMLRPDKLSALVEAILSLPQCSTGTKTPCPGCDGYECDNGCRYPGAVPSADHSSPAATTGDIPSGSRPPASAATGQSAGGEAHSSTDGKTP